MGGKRTKKYGNGLGNTLMRAANRRIEKEKSDRHTRDDTPDQIIAREYKLSSIIEQNDLSEFLTHAIMSGREFTAEKDNVTIVVNDLPTSFSLNKNMAQMTEKEYMEKASKVTLTIPRRPLWNKNMTKKELITKENEAFLAWRRKLAEIEEKEGLVITPFERNIEVWRQLWRVIERSDVIVQIVDARNPLLFRSKDLEAYVQEIAARGVTGDGKSTSKGKKCILLLNKADLLTKKQRFKWAQYFKRNGISFIFWSAHREQEKLDAYFKKKQMRMAALKEGEEYDDALYAEEDAADEAARDAQEREEVESDDDHDDDDEGESAKEDDWTHIYTREELMEYFESLIEEFADQKKKPSKQRGSTTQPQQEEEEVDENNNNNNNKRITIGMVGYPNVGKSSTINVLLTEKKVQVAPTPGKTKHFQTLPIGDNIMLCDCPGLVFPSVVGTKESMVCDGVLPIDQLRQYRPPVALVCERIPRHVLEITYGIKLPRPARDEPKDRKPTAEELLRTYATARGFMSSRGEPDESRAARIILKDYVNGKLLYCHPPPKEPSNNNDEEEVEEIEVAEEDLEYEDDGEYFTESEDEEDGNGNSDDETADPNSAAKKAAEAFNEDNPNVDALYERKLERKARKQKKKRHQTLIVNAENNTEEVDLGEYEDMDSDEAEEILRQQEEAEEQARAAKAAAKAAKEAMKRAPGGKKRHGKKYVEYSAGPAYAPIPIAQLREMVNKNAAVKQAAPHLAEFYSKPAQQQQQQQQQQQKQQRPSSSSTNKRQ